MEQEPVSYTHLDVYKRQVIESGRTFCCIPIPLGEYDSFRLDIDGDFTLNEITVYAGETKVSPVISAGTLHQCLIYCPVALLAILLVFWAHKVRAGEMGLHNYMLQLSGKNQNQTSREVCWDYMRVLAAVSYTHLIPMSVPYCS